MSSFRRWYFFVVALISLQAVIWAVIALLRNLLLPQLITGDLVDTAEVERVAFQISVILVGLPLYLFHWRRANRLPDEQTGTAQIPVERTLYLYLMLSLLLIPLLTNANGFLQAQLHLASGMRSPDSLITPRSQDNETLLNSAIALLVLAVMFGYHLWLLRGDQKAAGWDFTSAALRRLFIYLFSAVGLFITTTAAAGLIRWLILAWQTDRNFTVSNQLLDNVSALIVGLVLWLIFWTQAQVLYRDGHAVEKTSLLRKVYLYAAIFFAILATVGSLTAFLAGLFHRLMGLDPPSGGGTVISTLIVATAVWAYHALVLHEDTREMPVQEEQAGVRRLYRYLVAGVGLLALLIGLGGLLGVLFDTGGVIVSQQKIDLTWFAATLLAGLAVWILPWRLIQQETAEPPPDGVLARASVVRRFYLFFFLLLATLTFLIAAVFVLSRILTVLLGETLAPGEVSNMGLAAAYLLMAAAVWLYHGWLLRQDGEVLEAFQLQQAADVRVVVVDDGSGRLGRRLIDALAEATTGVQVVPLGLTAAAAEAMGQDKELDAQAAVAAAGVIIGPWSMATAEPGNRVLEGIAASPAQKLLLPRPDEGWQFVGSRQWDEATAVTDTVRKVEEIAAGDLPPLQRPVTPAMIALLIVSTIVILILIMSLLDEVLPLFD